MITKEYLDSKRRIKIKEITEEIAVIRAQRESLKKEFQKKDDECAQDLLILTKERLDLINKGKYEDEL